MANTPKNKTSFNGLKLISDLLPSERKYIGRRVLNSTIRNAPMGTKIDKLGNIMLKDGSQVPRLGKGRGRNAQYGYKSAKDLSDEKIYFSNIAKQIKEDEARPEYAEEQRQEEQRQAEQRNGSQRNISTTKTKRLLDDKPQASADNSPSALEQIRTSVGKSSVPFTLKYGASAYDSVRKLKKQYNRVGTGSMIEDFGNSTMARLAQPFSDSSSQWWKDRINTPNGEASNIGKNIADEAMLGVAGGVVGKSIGAGFKGLKRSAEMYNHKVKRLAEQAEKKALTDAETLKNIRSKFDFDRSIAKTGGESIPKLSELGNRIKANADLVRQKTYDDMVRVPPRKPYSNALFGDTPKFKRNIVGDEPYVVPLSIPEKIKKLSREHLLNMGKATKLDDIPYDVGSPRGNPTVTRLFDTVSHNIKRKLGNRGMLNSNNDELIDLYNKTGDLNKARQVQRSGWNKLPEKFGNAGTWLGASAPLLYGTK